jgi:hypothetical protein
MERSASGRGVLALNSVDIVVLTGFAIAQPLFSLLARSAGFFLAHRSKPIDVLLLVFCAYAIPAGIAIALETLLTLVRPRSVMALHRVVLTALLTVNMILLVKRTGLPGFVSVPIALAAGIFLTVVYLRIRTWRLSLIYLSPTVLIFPAALLFFSPVSSFVLPGRPPEKISTRVENPVPIVLVVFDEFPLASLMNKDGQIDWQSYPNFADLSGKGTWYRNASTAGESTLLALPTILSGRYPDPNNPRLPDAEAYPYNLFTLLGSAYRMNVNENNTRLCPDQLCADAAPPAGQRISGLIEDASVLAMYAILPADLTGPLPDITQSWGNFRASSGNRPTLDMWRKFDEMTDWHDRPRQFREFVASIRPSAWPTVNFLHILLPHAPWALLPTGQRCMRPETRIRGLRGVNDAGLDPNQWTDDAWAAAQSYQRHLLQVEYVDRLLGSLVKHLRDTGTYDKTLLIVTADHGTSFRPGDSRRSVTQTNRSDIMSIPLFIKYPHQEQGGIDDRNAENVDILPTVLDVIKLKTTYKPDGSSLLGPPVAGRRLKTVVTDKERALTFFPRLDGVFATVSRKLELFGGAAGYDVYRLGDRYGWTGRKAPATAAATGIECQLDRDAYYSNVDTKAATVVTYITGQLQRRKGSAPAAPQQLAVAVNGTIRAVTQSYRDGDRERFAALVPEDSLRPGRNDISVFSVLGAGALGSIQRIATAQYKWGDEVHFGKKGEAGLYYGIGWSNPEPGFTWTDGHLATLYLPVPPPHGDVIMTANLSAFAPAGKLDHQTARVLVNQHEVARWVANGDFKSYTAAIPEEDLREGVVEIALELPEAACPIEIGAGTDARTLGLAVASLKLEVQGRF